MARWQKTRRGLILGPGNFIYITIGERWIRLEELKEEELAFIEEALEKFKATVGWTDFANWWRKKSQGSGLSHNSLAHAICEDLEARLGITEGQFAAPDWSEYASALIDEQYETEEDFLKITGMSKRHLYHLLASHRDLTFREVEKLANLLGAKLVLKPEADILAESNRETAVEMLSVLDKVREFKKEKKEIKETNT